MAKKKQYKLSDVISGGVMDVAPDTTIEKLNPMFFDLQSLLHQPEPLYRMDSPSNRYYYRFEKGEPVFYTSVTTLIKNTLPTSPHLIKWMISKGGDAGKDEALSRAAYGTFLHEQCAELLIHGRYDLDKLSEKLAIFLTKEKVTAEKGWEDELKKDVLAFAQFIIDRNVKPLAIEICLYHPTDGYAGALDLVCEMDFNKKRIRAVVDLKSGRKGFYESHEVQLGAYLEMWKVHFPDTPVERTFNWSPKAWRKVPTYNLQDQTDSKNIKKLPYLVELAKIEADKREDIITIVSGQINLLEGISKNIAEKSFTEIVKQYK
jgi:hypothetical protein